MKQRIKLLGLILLFIMTLPCLAYASSLKRCYAVFDPHQSELFSEWNIQITESNWTCEPYESTALLQYVTNFNGSGMPPVHFVVPMVVGDASGTICPQIAIYYRSKLKMHPKSMSFLFSDLVFDCLIASSDVVYLGNSEYTMIKVDLTHETYPVLHKLYTEDEYEIRICHSKTSILASTAVKEAVIQSQQLSCKRAYEMILNLNKNHYAYMCSTWSCDNAYVITIDDETSFITVGESNPLVLEVQKELQVYGYYFGSNNGILTEETQRAIQLWQQKNRLPPTGNVTQESRVMLYQLIEDAPSNDDITVDLLPESSSLVLRHWSIVQSISLSHEVDEKKVSSPNNVLFVIDAQLNYYGNTTPFPSLVRAELMSGDSHIATLSAMKSTGEYMVYSREKTKVLLYCELPYDVAKSLDEATIVLLFGSNYSKRYEINLVD